MKDIRVEVTCFNNNKKYKAPMGIDLGTFGKKMEISLEHSILGVRVNNKLEDLQYRVFKPKHIEYVDINSPDGRKMYIRSLTFVLYKACLELFKDAELYIRHSISKGLYCVLGGLNEPLSDKDVALIRSKMFEIVNENIPFKRIDLETEEAIKIFEENGLEEKARLHRHRIEFYTSVYSLEETVNSFYGPLVPSTGYLSVFDVVDYYDGILLRLPSLEDPSEVEGIIEQDKMYEIFKEHQESAQILQLAHVGNLNDCVARGNSGEIIKIAEALHEKKVAKIADMICMNKKNVRIILIAGPSSSGKTSFAKRLAIQLKVAGIKPMQISMDDFFLERDQTPKDENGDYNFEDLDALDVPLFNRCLNSLLNGETIHLPKYDFSKGAKYYDNVTTSITEEHVLLIEGIHGLNPDLIPDIEDSLTFKVYVSALTQIAIDSQNRIPTTDNRLLRRIIRDHKYRGHSALATLQRWKSVRKGEEKNIFPYQELADVMFNSALLYELGVLKKHANPILYAIKEKFPEYGEAKRLLNFLSYFLPIEEEEIPPTSILREFLGGSSFKY